MANPRRAIEEEFVESEELPEVLISPRRAARGRRFPSLRRSLTSVAVVGLLTTGTALTLFTTNGGEVDVADPAPNANVSMGLGRGASRPSLDPKPSQLPADAALAALAAAPTEKFEPSKEPEPTSESPTPTEEETTSSAPDYLALSADAGTRYTDASVNVRRGPGTGFETRTTMAEGTSVTITEWTSDGWQQINMNGKTGWIKKSLLTETKPATSSSSSSSSSGSSGGSSSGGIDTSQCSRASGAESGLTSQAVTALRAVCNKFPDITSFGGYRSDAGSYHGSGRAIDVMVSGERGWEVARWARANASELGVIEVLYSQQIWTTQRSSEGWRGFADRGNATANHYDHVHLSIR